VLRVRACVERSVGSGEDAGGCDIFFFFGGIVCFVWRLMLMLWDVTWWGGTTGTEVAVTLARLIDLIAAALTERINSEFLDTYGQCRQPSP
jgi:hypothetical protein